VLTAFVNALTLVALAAWIFYEGWQRLRNPAPVGETVMMLVAGAGLALNGGIMWGLRAARQSDINIRSAFVHMLGDLLGSVAIIVGALIIRYTGWIQVDPILSILIGVLIVWTAWDIIKESLNILLEGLPRGLELQSVTAAMCQVEGVLDVHDLHIWSLGSSIHALSCHVLIEDVPPSASNCILARINDMLAHDFPHPPLHRAVRARGLRCGGERLRDPRRRAAHPLPLSGAGPQLACGGLLARMPTQASLPHSPL
jgi:cobalt-zinc-cadmium efflux system protein